MYCGIDIGASTAKVVVLNKKNILASLVIPTRFNTKETARTVFEKGLQKAGITSKDIAYVVATGYGRRMVLMASRTITEITCHAAGAYHIDNSVKTVIDIGGQDSKGIALENGNVQDFIMNDKCAAGTGRFLEVMAQALEVDMNRLGELSNMSQQRISISSTCTVFAESEVISHRNQGTKKEDIIAGVHEAIASRVCAMVNQIKIEDTVMITGGVALNKGVVNQLSSKIEKTVIVPENPQIVGALGAALLAQNSL